MPGFFRRLRAGVHRHAHVRLGERRGVVGAVAGHGDELPVGLLALDERHLVLGRRLGQKVVDAGLGRDRGRRERIVAGDHHRLDAHRPQVREALADAAFDDVLEMNDAERAPALRDDERRAAGAGDALNDGGELLRHAAALRDNPRLDGFGGALANLSHVRLTVRPAARGGEGGALDHEIDSRHPRLRGEGHEHRLLRRQLAAAETVLLLRQDDDRTALRRLVRQRRELRRVSQRLLADAGQRDELRGLAIAERDRAGLVQEQRVHVAGGFDRPSRHRQHVVLHQPVHAGDADRRQQTADRRRNQADEQRDQHEERLRRARVDGERLQRDDGDQEHDRQPGEQDVERDLVRRLLPLGALDQRDHAIQEGLARVRPSP